MFQFTKIQNIKRYNHRRFERFDSRTIPSGEIGPTLLQGKHLAPGGNKQKIRVGPNSVNGLV